MPATDLNVDKFGYARAAELVPVFADLAHAPALAPGLQPAPHKPTTGAFGEATAGVAAEDDPVALAVDHSITTNPHPWVETALCLGADNGPGWCLGVAGAADDPRP